MELRTARELVLNNVEVARNGGVNDESCRTLPRIKLAPTAQDDLSLNLLDPGLQSLHHPVRGYLVTISHMQHAARTRRSGALERWSHTAKSRRPLKQLKRFKCR